MSSLTAKQLIVLTFALGLGTFINVLDSSIANVAIPDIAGALGISPNEGTWVITSFTVSNAIVLPLTGWLSRRFGEVKTFIWSINLFGIASWLCGLAPNIFLLIFFRVLQGAVAGSLIPLSQSLLLRNYPPEKKGQALAFWSMIVIVAPILGPILGGWITEHYGWSWIFYINVPLAFISGFITKYLLTGRETATEKSPIDVLGFILLIISISSFQIMLDKGSQLDWFDSKIIVSLGIVACIALLYFVVWEYKCKYPVVDFSLFRYRTFTVGSVLGMLGYMMIFGSMVILPLWLQTEMNYTSFWSGVAVAPIGLFSLVLSPIIGKNLHRINLSLLISFSFLIFGLSFFWFSMQTTQTNLQTIALQRTVQGIGVACYFIPLVTISLSEIPKHQLASASGVFNFLRTLIGGAVGTSLVTTKWNDWQTQYHSILTEKIDCYSPVAKYFMHSIQSKGFTAKQACKILDSSVIQQAGMLALNDIFFVCAIASFVLCALALTMNKRAD